MDQPHPLRVFRPLNLLILLVLQVITFYWLNFDRIPSDLKNVYLFILILGTQCIAAAGYLINDHYDREADAFNKPNKRPIERWSVLNVFIVYGILNFIGLTCGYLLGFRWLIIFTAVVALLWLYSLKAKHLPIAGNLIISWFGGLSVYLVYDVFGTQQRNFVIFYALFAALITFLREQAKDIEDMQGDELAGYKTLPIVTGFSFSKSILFITATFICAMYIMIQYDQIAHMFTGKLLLIYIAYQLFCIAIPMLILVFKIQMARSSADMKNVSSLLKYIMATGMLSMLFF
ncbi:MAG: hypothetical protein GC181_04785 [Bacteroidetes bacterium]|nr:hypothetical protein [Bacteroidota bacterium]